mgnify:CR=1 FL=1|jgi:hypothetical protein
MKITREALKNIVKETMIEESEYQEFFKRALEKAGKSIPSMSDEEKKKFFNNIEKTWKGKGAKQEQVSELTDAQKKLPPALQKAIEKKEDKKESVEESINEGPSTEEKRIAMLAVRKQAKYRNVSLEAAIQDQINALEELKRDAKRGKLK